jgi:glutaredoxin 2
MHENKAIAIEISNQGIRSVASEANGLAYFVSDNDTRVAVAGTKGITILTKEQARAVARELMEIVTLFVE